MIMALNTTLITISTNWKIKSMKNTKVYLLHSFYNLNCQVLQYKNFNLRNVFKYICNKIYNRLAF